jgi:hypothetical protein
VVMRSAAILAIVGVAVIGSPSIALADVPLAIALSCFNPPSPYLRGPNTPWNLTLASDLTASSPHRWTRTTAPFRKCSRSKYRNRTVNLRGLPRKTLGRTTGR